MLDNFKTGWRNKFEKRVEYVKELFNNVTVESIERYKGMLRIKFVSNDENVQYVLNAVSYKIERDSAKTCELCGKYGFRRDEWMEEPMCLCHICYVTTVDSILSKQ